ncbi:MAG: STAS domain-containing protein [Methylotetracoccus sp.]
MNLELDRVDERSIVRVNEERVDAHNSGELKEYLLDTLETGVTILVVDLAAVRFIDSSGLGALLSGYKNANLRRARFVLAGLQSRVQSMFELTRLHQVFEIVARPDDVVVVD